MIYKEFTIPLYLMQFVVLVDCTGEEADKEIRDKFGFDAKLTKDLSEGAPRGLFQGYNGIGVHDFGLMWFDGKRGADNLLVIAHECYHAVSFAHKSLGIKVSVKNDEPGAYLFHTIFGLTLEALDIELTVK